MHKLFIVCLGLSSVLSILISSRLVFADCSIETCGGGGGDSSLYGYDPGLTFFIGISIMFITAISICALFKIRKKYRK